MKAIATDGRTYIIELSELFEFDPKRQRKAKYAALTAKHKSIRTCMWGMELKRFCRLPDTIQIKECDLREEEIPSQIVEFLKSIGCK